MTGVPDDPREQLERRKSQEATEYRRRRQERVEDFRLWRDKVLLYIGGGGILVMVVLNSTIGFKDIGVALALVTAFAGFASAPTALRLDERRRERKDNDR